MMQTVTKQLAALIQGDFHLSEFGTKDIELPFLQILSFRKQKFTQ